VGLVDAFRERYPEDRLYTYWDYRPGISTNTAACEST